jgi:hypothetical protein
LTRVEEKERRENSCAAAHPLKMLAPVEVTFPEQDDYVMVLWWDVNGPQEKSGEKEFWDMDTQRWISEEERNRKKRRKRSTP